MKEDPEVVIEEEEPFLLVVHVITDEDIIDGGWDE